MKKQDFCNRFTVSGKEYSFYDIERLKEQGLSQKQLPYSIRILLENILRNLDGELVTEKDLHHICNWQKHYATPVEIPFHPSRVLMQDFTGVPAVVDLAAMRDAMVSLGGDPAKINPLIPVELVVDHSVQVDRYGSSTALQYNVAKEYERNGERYAFLKWAQESFDNFKVVPPNSGICHQVNLEYLARVISVAEEGNSSVLHPDTLLGTDSHTTMINGSGVLGWGVGGIEAEAVMLGQPYFMPIPEVIGVELLGELGPGVTTTDLALSITELLRSYNVVGKFVEFFGEGSRRLGVTDRACIANMSPEYGATMGYFPVDEQTIQYLRFTNREAQARITQSYCQANGLFYTAESTPQYSDVLLFDLAGVEPCVAGPARPQDRIPLKSVKEQIRSSCDNSSKGFATRVAGKDVVVNHGSIAIAAITSCTNTSNPHVLMGAGLMAEKAVALGLSVPGHVKTSFAPGSKVVVDYLRNAGLMQPLEALGFHVAGFGCTTCIGNSGPLDAQLEKTIADNDLSLAAVLSGNRNFEARIHQSIKMNFLASPMLVLAFALCGRMDVDLESEALGMGTGGEPVYLHDIWPDNAEIEAVIQAHVSSSLFRDEYASIFEGDSLWQEMTAKGSSTFSWDKQSSYIKHPPYFEGISAEVPKAQNIRGARALLLLGGSVTTDHISPAGAIPDEYPAGKYLNEQGVGVASFNSYGSRRGNHEVMVRGTYGNIRIKNALVAPEEGSFTLKFPESERVFIHEAASRYQREGTPLVVLAGKEYGTGSSRDWAAKGTRLLGIKAVIARSYERIHRSNLVGMGVLPLQFLEGDSWQSLGLDGSETYDIGGICHLQPQDTLEVQATKDDGTVIRFRAYSLLNSHIEISYYQHGGILPYVLRKLSF
jgi:aconitate hydratase